MSRHRLIRNLDADDALAEEQDEYPGITPDQQVQLEESLSAVLSLFPKKPRVANKEIRDQLWDSYFDVDSVSGWALDLNDKREKKEKTKAEKAKTPTRTVPGTGAPSSKELDVSNKQKTKTPNSSSQAKSKLQAQDGVPSASATANIETAQPSEPTSKSAVSRDKILTSLQDDKDNPEQKRNLSLVVIGHVDAGKSTLLGRLVSDLGILTSKQVEQNKRQSEKAGKGSFAHAWAFDADPEERERGVTINISLASFNTPNVSFTVIDAPGHKDFVPNMISGASQADIALLVVDARAGEFEKGFEGGGQTREHAQLVRSLGISQCLVAVNKMDAVGYSQQRYEDIKSQLEPFLLQCGFQSSTLAFVPLDALTGKNLAQEDRTEGLEWYLGGSLLGNLEKLETPQRSYNSPVRLPISNVFKGGTGSGPGVGVSGRIESGILVSGERLRILPGDETTVIRRIEVDGEPRDWALAGSNVTVYLGDIDPVYLRTGYVLCPPDALVPLSSQFLAQIVVFDIKYPITSGSQVELFHHSRDIAATVSKLEAVVDRSTNKILKVNPRMITKGSSARLRIKLRGDETGGPSSRAPVIPLETFKTNKGMGRVLLRRNGETIGAGIVLEV